MIKIAKLISREFVIGNFVDNFLTNVALISFDSNQLTGQQNLKLIPYMFPLTTGLVKIMPIDKVICMEDAPQRLQISYLEMIKDIIKTSSGQPPEIINGSNGISEADKVETGKDQI